jgi:transposase-like protein
MITNLHCPNCESDAIYSYGRTQNGKQRYLCLICNRQFIQNRSRKKFEKRPRCPLCKGLTHVYRKEKDMIRFRCAKYPVCRGYAKKVTSEANI